MIRALLSTAAALLMLSACHRTPAPHDEAAQLNDAAASLDNQATAPDPKQEDPQ